MWMLREHPECDVIRSSGACFLTRRARGVRRQVQIILRATAAVKKARVKPALDYYCLHTAWASMPGWKSVLGDSGVDLCVFDRLNQARLRGARRYCGGSASPASRRRRSQVGMDPARPAATARPSLGSAPLPRSSVRRSSVGTALRCAGFAPDGQRGDASLPLLMPDAVPCLFSCQSNPEFW